MWCSRDYKRLLILEAALDKRVIAESDNTENLALITRSLVAIIDMKRILRLRPKPRDVDTLELERQRVKRLKPVVIEEDKESLLGQGGGSGSEGGGGRVGSAGL